MYAYLFAKVLFRMA